MLTEVKHYQLGTHLEPQVIEGNVIMCSTRFEDKGQAVTVAV